MDRSKVRIGLISIGIIAGLTLILYLPVLFWSPWWLINGYYEYLGGPSGIHYIIYNESEFSKNTFDAGNHLSETLTHYHYQLKREGIVPPSHGLLPISKGETIAVGPDGSGYIFSEKIINPITLWYIKWLEWTSD